MKARREKVAAKEAKQVVSFVCPQLLMCASMPKRVETTPKTAAMGWRIMSCGEGRVSKASEGWRKVGKRRYVGDLEGRSGQYGQERQDREE